MQANRPVVVVIVTVLLFLVVGPAVGAILEPLRALQPTFRISDVHFL